MTDDACIAARLQFGVRLVAAEPQRRQVVKLLAEGGLGRLTTIRPRRRDKFGKRAKLTVENADALLASEEWDALGFERGRPDASVEIENGVLGIGAAVAQYNVHVMVPLDGSTVVDTLVSLATVLEIAAGFISVEPTFNAAHKQALGGFSIPERATLGEQRRLERSGRDTRGRRLPTEIAGPEWGTFLGPGHLEKISAAQLRDSGAFERVVEISPRLVFLQLTADPRDDLSGKVEEKLPAAREALRPLLMDLADVIVA